MVALISFLLNVVASLFKSKSRLEAENAALRHQLIRCNARCAFASPSRTAIACSLRSCIVGIETRVASNAWGEFRPVRLAQGPHK